MIHADFVHLHIHTQYSLLDGACHLEKLVQKAKKLKLPALAITDHGNLFGAIHFYNLCLKHGVKPIIGCEVYVAPESRFKKEYKQGEESNFHLILLAKNEVGYKNLLKLTSAGFLEGFYYKPRIDKELLAAHSEGLIGLSACLKGEIPFAAVKGDINQAYKFADEYNTIFGKGNFYLEIMENGIKEQTIANKNLVKISKDLDIPLVATNDVHYLEQHQAFAHEVLMSIQTQTTIDDPKRFKFSSDTFYFRTPDEMKEIFKDYPDAIKNTIEITQKCNLTFDFTQTHLPKFPLSAGETENEYLKKLCCDNLASRYSKNLNKVNERLDYELDVIRKTGFSSYFLIVWDLIKYSKENNIPVGPGRGSAAGSIVSYLLGITDVDPLKYNLLFERFLNPERINMPDIDIDFCYEKRSEVLKYVAKRYGEKNVAQIITFGTMQARAVVRDVGRVLGVPYAQVDKVAKMIPSVPGHNVGLKEALKINPEFKNEYESSDGIKRLVDTAIELEGLSRHASTHAAGVVISDMPLVDRIPLTKGSEGEPITGFDMNCVEKVGLLKMDFLGLKTLTVVSETLKIVKRTHNLDLDIDNIPLVDKSTFDLLRKAATVGVFQLESRGMRDILKKIVPTRFEDLIAVLALYRPGPLGSGMVEDYIERKHGRKPVAYDHPLLEEILRETYGIILYQEQTMQIASGLGGFSLAQADLLRKAIGKKIPEIMEEQKDLFIEGCKKNKVPPKIASSIFDLIEYFSGYGFNKSHSTAYALISYRTAFLKANYGVEFMAALLTSERNNTDKIVEYIHEAGDMGIDVLPPDINESFANFTVTKDKNIRFGLMAIKNVGGAALESIIAVRREKRFEDFFDFCKRVDSRTVNKRVLESLIRSGAMDGFGLNRAQMAMLLDDVLIKALKKSKEEDNQLMFFKSVPQKLAIPDVEEWPMSEILGFEKKLLGMYVSSHPLKAYSKLIKLLGIKSIAYLFEKNEQRDITIIGVMGKIKNMTTRRKNEKMAIVKIEDELSSIEAFVFPRCYEEFSQHLIESKVVVVKGSLQLKDSAPKMIANEIIPVEELLLKVRQLNIFVDKSNFNLKGMKSIFVNNRGNTPVCFVMKGSQMGGVRIKTAQDFHLLINEPFLERLNDAIGAENFRLVF